MHLRFLQFHLKNHWSQEQDATSNMVPISGKVSLDMIWLIDVDNLLAGTPLSLPPADIQLFTDSSKQGQIAHLLHLQASSLWDPREANQHINILELQAVKLGSLPGKECVSDVRQLLGGIPHKEPGRHEIMEPVSDKLSRKDQVSPVK